MLRLRKTTTGLTTRRLNIMKLPILLAGLCATASATEQSQPLPLSPLPSFHESWSDGEIQLISAFANRIDRFLLDNHADTDNQRATEIYSRFRQALHQAIATGKVEPSFQGDTMARWAAMVDDDLAVQVFIGHGEDPHARYYIEDLELESGLVQEVIWAKNLTGHASMFDRIQLLNWLKSKGWDPVADQDLVVHAISLALLAEPNNMEPLLKWFFEQSIELKEEQKSHFYRGILVADGSLPYLKQLVEKGEIPLNEPIDDLLPLQTVCSWTFLEKQINLDNLAYLLEAGADPNLILAEEDGIADTGNYDPEGYEEDDLPRDDMGSFSTPIEIIFDQYRSDASERNHKRESNFLAAIDLLLLHDAELDIEDDECNDEDAESTAYAEVRKRLEMTPKQLREDFERLTE